MSIDFISFDSFIQELSIYFTERKTGIDLKSKKCSCFLIDKNAFIPAAETKMTLIFACQKTKA